MGKKIFFIILITFLFNFIKAQIQDEIIVKINDEIILKSEIDETVELLEAQMKLIGKKVNRDELKKEVLNEMIEQKLIITMANDENIKISDEAVDDKVNEYINSLRSRFSDEEEFNNALLKEGLSFADFRLKLESQVRDKLLFNKIKQKKQQEFIGKAIVSEDEIKKFYLENKDNFKINDEVNISQIFFDKSKDKNNSFKNKAKNINERLKRGENFNEILKTLRNEEGIDGGDLGWIDTTQLNKKIRDALQKVKKGSIIGPIETEDGYHIIKINDIKKGTYQELSDVKEKVRIKIIEKKVDIMWKEWIEKIKKQAYFKKL